MMGTLNKRGVILASEVLGSLAVLLGLIFVGLELRNTTAAMQSATLQSVMDKSIEYVNMMASDPELTEVWMKASNDPASLNDVERAQWQFLLRGQWFRFQTAFLHWQRGTLSDDD